MERGGFAVTVVSPRPTDPSPPETEVLFKEARRRRRQRRLGWIVVMLLIAGTTAVVASSRQSPGHPGTGRPSTTSGRAVAPRIPADVVGWTSGFKVVVVSTHTGQVVRTLVSHVSVFAPGIPNVSVAPNGTVFFESATPSPHDTTVVGGDQILSVPITGGPVHDLGPGSDPQISPNGKFLAFIAPDPQGAAGEAPYLVPPVGIDIATLSAGSIGTVKTFEPGPQQLDRGASDLSWSSNSQRLSFNLLDSNTNVTTAWTLPLDTTAQTLAGATEIPLHSAALSWNGYWGTHDGAEVGLGVLHSGAGRLDIVTVNPTSGAIIDRLFRVRGADFSDFSNDVIGDSAGTSVLVAGVTPFVDGTPTTSGKVLLYQWKVGETNPRRLSDQVEVASWGPIPAP
jgi:hypothetical protein